MSDLYQAIALEALQDLRRQPTSSAAYISAFRFAFGWSCDHGSWSEWRREVLGHAGIDLQAYMHSAMQMVRYRRTGPRPLTVQPDMRVSCTDEWESE